MKGPEEEEEEEEEDETWRQLPRKYFFHLKYSVHRAESANTKHEFN